jgi:2-keto-3-deoxy-L-rhamnonate aldolase RhmA
MKNDLKIRLRKGESLLGTMVTLVDNLQIARILKVCGFDFFVIDCEHGSFDYSAVANIVAMARELGIAAVIRVPEIKREVVLKYMEMGAAGLLLPNTETAEQARLLVEYAKYAPLGNRGMSLLRPHAGYEKIENAGEYLKRVNEETILMVQIESRRGVENAGTILAVEGVDAAFVGPGDLSQSLGLFGQLAHPEFVAAVDRVTAAARGHGKHSGIHNMAAIEALDPWLAKGMTLNLWANDVLFIMNAAREGLAKFKNKNLHPQ